MHSNLSSVELRRHRNIYKSDVILLGSSPQQTSHARKPKSENIILLADKHARKINKLWKQNQEKI